MAKLQKTTRGNGSVVWSLNIPQEIMEQMNWEKGQELDILKNFDRLMISRKEKDVSEIRDISGHGKDVEILPKDKTGEDSPNQCAAPDQEVDSGVSPGSEGVSSGDTSKEDSNGGVN